MTQNYRTNAYHDIIKRNMKAKLLFIDTNKGCRKENITQKSSLLNEAS